MHVQHVDRRVPNEIRFDRIDHLIMEGTNCRCPDGSKGSPYYVCTDYGNTLKRELFMSSHCWA